MQIELSRTSYLIQVLWSSRYTHELPVSFETCENLNSSSLLPLRFLFVFVYAVSSFPSCTSLSKFTFLIYFGKGYINRKLNTCFVQLPFYLGQHFGKQDQYMEGARILGREFAGSHLGNIYVGVVRSQKIFFF